MGHHLPGPSDNGAGFAPLVFLKHGFSGGSLVVFIAIMCINLFRYKVLKIYNVTRRKKPKTKPSNVDFAQ